MTAFVAPTPIFSGSKAISHVNRRPSNPITSTRQIARAVMTENSSSSIDFSNIDIQGAGSNLAGMVFTPETESDIDVKTRVNVGYTPDQEVALNAHINVEYTASYVYHAIWSYFDKDTVALPGFAKFFKEQSDEEREHAEEFMKYQNKRGGQVVLQPLAVPNIQFSRLDGTSDATYAMDLHLQLEKFVYEKLISLHKVAENADDAQMQDFVENYMNHQVDAIKDAADKVAQLKRVGTPHGIFHFDLTLRDGDAA